MNMEEMWNDNDRGKLKYWEKNVVQHQSLGDQKISEASCCKYLRIIIGSDLS
jgi:hypothetical protein